MKTKFRNCLNVKKYTHVENDASYALERSNDKLTIYFQWSNGKNDWKNNFDFPAKPYRDMENTWYCHRGFLKVWKSIESYIANDILDTSITKIDIIGYSHGGAIAQLCYEYVKFNRPDVEVTGVGFGSPRVFWGWANKTVKERFKGFIVIRNGNDIVTRLPPILFGFRHIGEVRSIGTKRGLIKDHYPKHYLEALDDCEVESCTTDV
jgi:predicted lipase